MAPKSVPEIERVIQLCGHKNPSLCMRQVKVKMAGTKSFDAMVACEGGYMAQVEEDQVLAYALADAESGVPQLLNFSSGSDSTLTGFGDFAHIGTFDLLLGEFNMWIKNGASTHCTKVFKFLDQKGVEFRKKIYNYKQCKWYDVPLVVLHSVANYNTGMPSFSFIQPPVSMPFVSKVIDTGITMNLITDPSPEIIHMLAVFAYGRKDLYTSYENEDGQLVDNTNPSYFVSKFSAPGMCFLYTTTVDGVILSVMSFVCYSSNMSVVINILTTQANNKQAHTSSHKASTYTKEAHASRLQSKHILNTSQIMSCTCILSIIRKTRHKANTFHIHAFFPS